MEKIRDYEHFSEVVEQAKASLSGETTTNCYILPEKISEYAGDGRLYYEMTDSGAVIFCDMDWYYNLYYFVDSSVQISIQQKDKPVSVEFITIDGRKDDIFSKMTKYWQNAGFVLNSRRRRLFAEYNEESLARLNSQYEVKHEVKPLLVSQLPEATDLLLATFKPVTNLFRSRKDMLRLTEEGYFLCTTDQNGKLLMVVEYEYERGLFKMWRVAVDPSCKGQRLQWHSRRYVTNLAWEKGYRKTTAWIEDGNDISTHNIVKRVGMDYDGRISEQYVLW